MNYGIKNQRKGMMNVEKKGLINGLYFEVKGSGQPIIFLHGIGGTHKMFEPQVNAMVNNYQTITVDLKGNGQSESVFTRNYLDVHCESILDLMSHLQIKDAIFVGLSYGGIVAQVFAIRYPEKVKKMVLLDTYAQMFPKDIQQLKLTLFGAFITLASWMPARWIAPLFAPYKKWELAHKELLSIFENWRAKDVTLQLLEVFGMDLLQELNQLEIPVLVIVGDTMQTVVDKSQEIVDHLPNSELLVVRDSMDPTNLCQPEIVNEAILEFALEKEKSLV